jgi:hypothetical protein
VAGLGIVVISVNEVKVIRGGKNPLFVELISNFAEASGEVVPMPVWENAPKEINKKKTIFFIFI